MSTFASDAKPLGVAPTVSPVHGLVDIERDVAETAGQTRTEAFSFPRPYHRTALVEQTVASTSQNCFPAIFSERAAIAYGGLASYGTDRR